MFKYGRLVRRVLCGRNANHLKTIRQRTLPISCGAINRLVHSAALKRCKNSDHFTKLPSDDLKLNDNRDSNTLENRLENPVHGLEETIDQINRNYRVMICMRGAPGSGKSHLARHIIDRTVNGGSYDEHIFSADDFFYDRQTKEYNYDRSRVREAHDANKVRVSWRARGGWSPIIVDNTHTKLWEMFAYVKEGVRNGYEIKILEPSTPWARSADELTLRNQHNVDCEKIQRMLQLYEPGSVADVLKALKLHPARPTLRNFPPIRGNHSASEK